MATVMVCDSCGEPIEPGTPYEALVTWDVSQNDEGVTINGVSTEYDYHPGHRPTADALKGGAEAK